MNRPGRERPHRAAPTPDVEPSMVEAMAEDVEIEDTGEGGQPAAGTCGRMTPSARSRPTLPS